MDNKLVSRREFVFASLALVPALNCHTGAVADADGCSPTVRGNRGPFYRSDAPWRTKLCDADEPGEPLVIAGRVVAADNCRPLTDAVVDVWQADATGRYDNDSSRFHLRGKTKTDRDGRYRFETILPANYGDGGFQRAKHIHYIVSCAGYESQITECYFEGDPCIKTDSLAKSSLVIPLSAANRDGEKRKHLRGTFDIVLARTRQA